MTPNNMETMISRHEVDVVLEVTGNVKVRQDIIKMMRKDQDIISTGAAQMMFNLMTRQIGFHDEEILPKADFKDWDKP